jgi:hypothetical protein
MKKPISIDNTAAQGRVPGGSWGCLPAFVAAVAGVVWLIVASLIP